MLAIFNLDWKRFSISKQVAEAGNFMSRLTRDVGVGDRVIFNCASMGTGEYVLPFADGERAEDVSSDALNYLRWQHHHVREALKQDQDYRLNFETREMLSSMRKSGHVLVAVFTGATHDLEKGLEEARCRDVFEDHVIGYDRLTARRRWSEDLTSAGLYRQAGHVGRLPLYEALIVADHPEGVEDACAVRPQAVVGYIGMAEEDAYKDAHIKDLESAGADYTLIGGHAVACLPYLFQARSNQRAAKAQLSAFLSNLTGSAPH
ncbi:MAG: hypothetical protein RBR86_07875 [Pseudobdellovibrionaceae bacterium]|jgi:hypothetical protein|nr:hypothetical protein [Pseudobdellovibrionaceae bacterium]